MCVINFVKDKSCHKTLQKLYQPKRQPFSIRLVLTVFEYVIAFWRALTRVHSHFYYMDKIFGSLISLRIALECATWQLTLTESDSILGGGASGLQQQARLLIQANILESVNFSLRRERFPLVLVEGTHLVSESEG